MNRDGAAVEAFATRPLSPAASGQLAHDLRAAIHVIRGHAELLRGEATEAETRESARYIFDASVRVGDLCEDVVDYLRLPAVAQSAQVALGLDALGRAVSRVAADRGVPLRVVEPACQDPTENDGAAVTVDATVRRIVAHVLDHTVRSTASAVTITATIDWSRERCALAVSPAPAGSAAGDDGVVSIAGDLLAAFDARLSVFDDDRIDLEFPIAVS